MARPFDSRQSAKGQQTAKRKIGAQSAPTISLRFAFFDALA
jgi:hypothetical protein